MSDLRTGQADDSPVSSSPKCLFLLREEALVQPPGQNGHIDLSARSYRRLSSPLRSSTVNERMHVGIVKNPSQGPVSDRRDTLRDVGVRLIVVEASCGRHDDFGSLYPTNWRRAEQKEGFWCLPNEVGPDLLPTKPLQESSSGSRCLLPSMMMSAASLGIGSAVPKSWSRSAQRGHR